MNVDPEISSVLSAASPVVAIVSTRLYPLVAPQDSDTPYVVWQRISTVVDGAHDSDGTVELHRSLFQFSCFADTFAEVDALAAAVRTALLAGSIGQTSIEEGRRDTVEQAARLHRADLDIVFYHSS